MAPESITLSINTNTAAAKGALERLVRACMFKLLAKHRGDARMAQFWNAAADHWGRTWARATVRRMSGGAR